MTDNTQRFSSRVDNYVKYRPNYPAAIVDVLRADYGLTPDSTIADIGAGTGILSALWLRNGNRVFGVEPNREMREAGERLLAAYPNFTSVDGTAEATTLAADSVDFVSAGQAFHWFDQPKVRIEWARMLKPTGWAVVIWNVRRADTPFLHDYETVLQTYGTDYNAVKHRNPDDEDLSAFYGGDSHVHTFANQQLFDLEGLLGRVFSSSYTPEPDHPNYAPLHAALQSLFAQHQTVGQVAFEYETRMYVGRLANEQ